MDEDSKPLLGSVRAGEYYTDSLDPKQRRYCFSAGFSLMSSYQNLGEISDIVRNGKNAENVFIFFFFEQNIQ